MRNRPLAMATVGGLLFVSLACGGDGHDAGRASTASATTTPPAIAVSTPPTTAIAPTTAHVESPASAASTAKDTITTAAPGTAPASAGSWFPVEFVPRVVSVGYSGNFEGVESPPPPSDPAAPLADGYYHADLAEPWSSDSPEVLHVEVARYVACEELVDVCHENPGVSELGVDPSWSRRMVLALDDTMSVVLRGFRCFGVDEVKQATGAHLADLLSAYDREYESAIEPRVDGGATGDEIAAAVAESPVGGFLHPETLCPEGGAGVLLFSHGDAPVLLLQSLTRVGEDGEERPLGATDLVDLQGVDVRDGVMTFYFYAGFHS